MIEGALIGAGERTPTRLAGLGAVTGYGWGVDALRTGLASGKSAAAVTEVDGIDALVAVVPDPGSEELSHDDRYETAALAAVDEAVDEATARGWQPGATVGLIFCTGIADVRTLRDHFFSGRRPKPSMFPHMLHTAPGSVIGRKYGWTGPNVVLNAACSSGNAALQMADLWLRAGLASDVVVVAAEFCLIEQVITGFRRMRVMLSEKHDATECRPFQEGSRGFFLGEGAVALVVTSRADRGRATYLGGATTHDAFHLVAPASDGAQQERCLTDALAAAAVHPHDVAVYKAHGSGTPLNDRIEADLTDRLFPDTTRLCTYKPMLGHAMAAASLVEMAGLLVGHQLGRLPRRVTDDPSHPQLADGEAPPPGPAVCASVGLGGTNTAAVLDIHTGERP